MEFSMETPYPELSISLPNSMSSTSTKTILEANQKRDSTVHRPSKTSSLSWRKTSYANAHIVVLLGQAINPQLK